MPSQTQVPNYPADIDVNISNVDGAGSTIDVDLLGGKKISEYVTVEELEEITALLNNSKENNLISLRSINK